MIRAQSRLSAKHVSSVKLECSLYGTPYIRCLDVLPLIGISEDAVKTRACCLAISGAIGGNVTSVPAGGAYVQPVGRKATVRVKNPLNVAK